MCLRCKDVFYRILEEKRHISLCLSTWVFDARLLNNMNTIYYIWNLMIYFTILIYKTNYILNTLWKVTMQWYIEINGCRIVIIFIVFVFISNWFPWSIQDNSLQINWWNDIILIIIHWKISINYDYWWFYNVNLDLSNLTL